MKTVYKYQITPGGITTISMPDGAKIVHVGVDWIGSVCMWAYVDTQQPSVDRKFIITGTGHELGDVERYVGTVIQRPFVWHIWEVT